MPSLHPSDLQCIPTLELQVETWLTSPSVFYPPHKPMMVPVAVAAIKACREGDFDREVELPEGLTYRGNKTVNAGTALETLHLEGFLYANS